MAQLKDTVISGNLRVTDTIYGHNSHHVYYVKGTQTGTTGSWTGNLPEVSELYEGLTILYWLPYAGSGNATLNLTLKGGTTTGAINCYTINNSRLTTHVPQYGVMELVYQTVTVWGTSYTGWWLIRLQDSNDSAGRLYRCSGNYKADSITYRYQLMFQTGEYTFTPLNNANNDTSTSKTILTDVEFNPMGEILYWESTDTIQANGDFSNLARWTGWIDLRYTFNCGTNSLTAHRPLYLKVVLQPNGKVKLASVNPLAQELPSTNDGYLYIRLGMTYSTYQLSLEPWHKVYYYNGIEVVEYTTDTKIINNKENLIIKNVSNSIVSFNDGANNLPIEDLNVEIKPIQDLNGYDHPWPAGGGKNLANLVDSNISSQQYCSETYPKSGSLVVTSTANYGRVGYSFPVISGETYTIKFKGVRTTGSYGQVFLCHDVTWSTSDPNYIKNFQLSTTETYYTNTITATSNAIFVGFYVSSTNDSGDVMTINEFQIEKGSSATTFAPYSNICPISGHTEMNLYHEAEYDAEATPKVTIDLDGTRYGGTLDVLTGKMTVNRAYKTYTGNDVNSYGQSSTYNTNYVILSLSPSAITTDDIVLTNLCDRYKFVLGNSYHFGARITSQSALRFYDDRFTNEATAKSILTTETPSICYYLATPFTVQLTPAQLNTLLGENNIWASTGDISLKYWTNSDFSEYLNKRYAQKILATTTTPGLILEAPLDSKKYIRENGTWIELSTIISVSSETLNITI